ncbi:hypothetical protein REC12_11660 [Desulfosporosinus sp. PR]|uniref:hypothetical protein n=1 Tax=Candidatus Desulfosporosinus nitrosoreducens TaxID=3401928 RepID=UPI0027F697F4|nr:hypothetical protein [Desulfosporosinus sp. PR]MDQ7094246.1 hypothetical protein [Desulfosporosinus sp. PR]
MNTAIVPVFLAIVGLFLIGGIAANIVEKTGQHGPDMAKTIVMVLTVAGLGITVGILSNIVMEITTVFNLR